MAIKGRYVLWLQGGGGVEDYRADASPNMYLPDWLGWTPRPFHFCCGETGTVDFWLNKDLLSVTYVAETHDARVNARCGITRSTGRKSPVRKRCVPISSPR